MITPVFLREARRAGGRPWVLILRWGLGTALVLYLLGIPVAAWADVSSDDPVFDLPVLFPPALPGLLLLGFLLTVLLAPALGASAVTEEKNAGTLEMLLASGFSAWDILAGKLLGRLWRVLLILLPLGPVICLCAGLAGLDGGTLLAVLFLPLGPLVALGAAGLLASVWARTTTQAVAAVYTVGIAGWLVAAWSGVLPRCFDPSFVLAPALAGDGVEVVGRRLAGALLAWGGVAGLCLGLAVWRLRPACMSQAAGRKGPKKVRDRPPPNDDPLFWKAFYVEGASPALGLGDRPTWQVLAGVVCLSLLLLVALLRLGFGSAPGPFPISATETAVFVHGLIITVLGVVLIGVRSAGASRSAHQRGSWEALLLAGLSPRELLRGEARGIFWVSALSLLAALVPAVWLLALAVPGDEQGPVLYWPLFWALLAAAALRVTCAAGLATPPGRHPFWEKLKLILGELTLVTLVVLAVLSLFGCPMIVCTVAVAVTAPAIPPSAVTQFRYGMMTGLAVLSLIVLSVIADSILHEAESRFERRKKPRRPPPPGVLASAPGRRPG
jgi:ABC-type transport system involved in multi-copper enzyme maturation permease subunit